MFGKELKNASQSLLDRDLFSQKQIQSPPPKAQQFRDPEN